MVDADGSIGIYYRGRQYHLLYPRITLAMTHLPILELFAARFDRPVWKGSKSKLSKKSMYQVWAEGAKAYPIIKELYPHLIIKKQIAKEAIDLWEERS